MQNTDAYDNQIITLQNNNAMNLDLQTKVPKQWSFLGVCVTFFLTMLCPNIIVAQQSNLVANHRVDWAAPTFSNFTITKNATSGVSGQTSSLTNENNVVDANVSNSATLVLHAQQVGGALGCITPVSTNGQGTLTITNGSTYNLGNYVSFVITDDANTTFSVQTSANGTTFTPVNTQAKIDMGSGNVEIGGFSAAAYSHVRLVATLAAPTCGTTITRTYQITKVSQVSYAAAPNTICNQTSALVHILCLMYPFCRRQPQKLWMLQLLTLRQSAHC